MCKMKRFALLVLILFVNVSVYAQSQWEEQPIDLSIRASAYIGMYDVSSNSVTLCNRHAESKENQRKNIITSYSGVLPLNVYNYGTVKRISFNIQDINNNPARYRYAVLNEKGKEEYTREIYWGVTVYMGGEDGREYNVSYLFGNKGSQNGASQSYKQSGFLKNYGTFSSSYYNCFDLPSRMEIILQENYDCLIRFDESSVSGIKATGIKNVKRIEFHLCAGAAIRIYNLKVERQTLYAKVAKFITAGDKCMQARQYYQATLEYSKAIDRGYKSYDIYFKRAIAYFACEFYNNAIDDCTKALSYRSTAEVYLLRGKAKLQKSDISCIDDLKKGGSEGLALVREIEQ